ncbi:ABC-three component system protein [Microvirga terrestris]|uniref:ABC-three component system protein n=1 Tax=Microvirga terrestris TaxID=2791024 RepID=UPI003CCF8E11
MISRDACVRQCREIERLQARQRFLPRPARDLPIGNVDRDRALTRPFVEHLSRTDAEEDDIFQAVEHFIQFNVEKHRLALEGEIADREWRDRGDRLRQRWKNIARSTRLDYRGQPPQEIGKRILAQATYQHLEPLGGETCNELYMTSGHYHRLADDDEVWWDPTYQSQEAK